MSFKMPAKGYHRYKHNAAQSMSSMHHDQRQKIPNYHDQLPMEKGLATLGPTSRAHQEVFLSHTFPLPATSIILA